jgi:uncharacterized membrane protein YhaH (DUF805 family)
VDRKLQIREALNLNWTRLLLSSSGRIDRASWWIASCALIVVGAIVLKLIDIVATTFSAVSIGIVLMMLFVLLLYCLLAVGVKRLHDRNKRGWWAFLFLLLPLVLAFAIGALAPDLGPELTWTGIAIVLILGAWALIELGILAGTAGANRYGPAPVR